MERSVEKGIVPAVGKESVHSEELGKVLRSRLKGPAYDEVFCVLHSVDVLRGPLQ